MFVVSYVSSIGALVLLWLVYPKARPVRTVRVVSFRKWRGLENAVLVAIP